MILMMIPTMILTLIPTGMYEVISGPLDAQLVFQLESQLILMWIDLQNFLQIALILWWPFIVSDGSDGGTGPTSMGITLGLRCLPLKA